MNSAILEHKTEASDATPTIPLDEMEIVYPRWISHLVKDRVMVNSAEEAAPYYADGFTPWPVVIQPTDAEIVKEKVLDLEKQIETLLGSLSEEDAERVTQEIYGSIDESADAAKDTKAVKQTAKAPKSPKKKVEA